MANVNGGVRALGHPPGLWIRLAGIVVVPAMLAALGCTPTVKVAPPDEPITINLNVKIEHEVRVKVEKDLEEVFSEESGLF